MWFTRFKILLLLIVTCTIIYLALLIYLPAKTFRKPKWTHIHNFTAPPLPNGSTDWRTESRRERIKQTMIQSWDGYQKYAWEYNELAPISKQARENSVFGGERLGVTIIDGLDTLYLMGLEERYKEGRDWIENHFSFSNIDHYVSVFEVTIRLIGGLLSCFALTSDPMFVTKAAGIADRLLPAFDQSPTGLPYSWVNPSTGKVANYVWASQWWPWPYQHILAEVGSLHLEFTYLSAVTGNRVYADKVNQVREVLQKINKHNGLYSNFIDPATGQFRSTHVSLGAFGDSFYEYLLKTWQQSGKNDTTSLEMYRQAIEAIDRNLVHRSRSGLVYLAEVHDGKLEHKMGHLACFAAGMFALGATSGIYDDREKMEHFLKLAEDLAETCRESYVRTKTKLGPEVFWFTEELDAQANHRDHYYALRPEAIESWFYLWRLTKNPKYREWAWDAVQEIEQHCRAPDNTGYSGITNVNDDGAAMQDDAQPSYWLAETIKYLYLIFSNDELASLDRWVFNTEGHLLPIQNHNPAFP